ncbi:40S ribosomal protein S19-3-like protein [Tanacetum coccineum]
MLFSNISDVSYITKLYKGFFSCSHPKLPGYLGFVYKHWTDIVKTATYKELAPYDPDWYYNRAASMERKIYLRGGLVVGAFQRIYGRSKRNGSAPPHFCKASGGIVRNILQQLQSMNIVDFDSKGGRKITSNGRRDLVQVTGRKSSGCYPLSEPSRFHLLSQQNHLKRPIISSTIQSETEFEN